MIYITISKINTFPEQNLLLYPQNRSTGVVHSYLIELKYLRSDASDSRADGACREVLAQLKQYGQDHKLQVLQQGTVLHRVVAVIKNFKIVLFEEI